MRAASGTLVAWVWVSASLSLSAGEACDPDTPLALSLLAKEAVESPDGDFNELDIYVTPKIRFSLDVTGYLEGLSEDVVVVYVCAGLFSMAVAHDEDVMELESVTVEGTDYGLLGESSLAVPTHPTSEPGFVAEDMLCFEPRPAPFHKRMSVVRARYAFRPSIFSPDRVGETIKTRLRFQDGLHGTEQPVTNMTRLDGEIIVPCLHELEIRLHILDDREFIRGDANYDARINVTDPVTVLENMFLPGSTSIRCLDAADSNDDGTIDLSDAIYVLSHLFAGGPAPPPPFPALGGDPTIDKLNCAELP